MLYNRDTIVLYYRIALLYYTTVLLHRTITLYIILHVDTTILYYYITLLYSGPEVREDRGHRTEYNSIICYIITYLTIIIV